MPTYEYECLECRHRFNVFQSMKDKAVNECEKCGKEVRKIYGATGIIFKGNGFYVNDYKKNGCSTTAKETVPSKSGDTKASSPCSSCESCPASS